MFENRKSINSFRYIFLLYISVIVVFSLLYIIPFSNQGTLKYIDALFISSSALSVTGLSTVDVSQTLSRVGQGMLIAEMQLGGIGILVLVSYLFLMMGKRITMSSMLLISKDQNQNNLKTIKSLSFSVLIIAVIIETLLTLAIYGDVRKVVHNSSDALFISIFHSVASFTNAGFYLVDMNYFKTDESFLLATAATIFIGSIGYPTIMEYIFSFRKKKSLFTKINIRMHFLLLAIGAVSYLVLEGQNILKNLSLGDKIINSLFLSASTRSGGLSTIEIGGLSSTTLLILMCLMFIGGASSSTGGGIRLTTFRVLIAKMASVVRSRESTVIGKKTITQEAINKSFLVFVSFVLLSFISTIILSMFEHQSVDTLSFEVMSALTNTGLSMGITSQLCGFSKFVLMILMIIGRIGIFTFIYLIFKVESSKVKYLKEDLAVG
ncbi:potassium transporter TrkG [Bacillus mexicanus]|uniref:TrkH family potassium uptake protein n=1 Tax=Bacillus mexicanus TaxID=2834415 RepID=UPI003D1B7403